MVDAGDVVDGRDAGDMGREGRGTWDVGRMVCDARRAI